MMTRESELVEARAQMYIMQRGSKRSVFFKNEIISRAVKSMGPLKRVSKLERGEAFLRHFEASGIKCAMRF